MTDAQQPTLPDALRAWAPLVAEGYEVPAASKAMLEAAAEIERLRAALQDIADISPFHFGRADDPCWVIAHAKEALANAR